MICAGIKLRIEMIYYLWMLHYAVVKRIYRKRVKLVPKIADALAFSCILLLLVFILILVVNNTFLNSILKSNITIAPIACLFGAIVTFIFKMLTPRVTDKMIGDLRLVVNKTQNLKHIYSVLYVSFYFLLFIAIIFISIWSVTHKY